MYGIAIIACIVFIAMPTMCKCNLGHKTHRFSLNGKRKLHFGKTVYFWRNIDSESLRSRLRCVNGSKNNG